MLKANGQVDKLATAHTDFSARGMLVGPCLIQAIKDVIDDNGDSVDDTTSDSDTNSDTSDENEFACSFDGTHDLNNSNTDTSNGHPPPQMLLGDEIEDNDCGPVKSGPLMNEVRLVSRKGQKPILCLYIEF